MTSHYPLPPWKEVSDSYLLPSTCFFSSLPSLPSITPASLEEKKGVGVSSASSHFQLKNLPNPPSTNSGQALYQGRIRTLISLLLFVSIFSIIPLSFVSLLVATITPLPPLKGGFLLPVSTVSTVPSPQSPHYPSALYFASSFWSCSFEDFCFSISARTTFSGALLTKLLFMSFSQRVLR